MEQENIHYRHFILNDEQPLQDSENIHTLKYFSLLLTYVLTIHRYIFEIDKLPVSCFAYISYLAVAIAFVISCFSQFIGIFLFILDFAFNSFNNQHLAKNCKIHSRKRTNIFHFSHISIAVNYLNQNSSLRFLAILIRKNFYRIFFCLLNVLQYIISVLGLSQQYYKDQEDRVDYSVLVLVLINSVLLFYNLNNFKPPQADSFLKEFFKSLFSAKIIAFSVLIASSYMLELILQNNIFIVDKMVQLIILRCAFTLTILLFIIFQSKIIFLDYYTTLILFVSFIALFTIGLLASIMSEIENLIKPEMIVLFSILIVIVSLWQMFVIPQFQQIFLNIGIRNIDFASSFQSLGYGVLITFTTFLQPSDPPLNSDIKDNNFVAYIMLSLMICFLFVFYQLLGFKQYFKISNRSLVENNYSIEIE